MKLTCDFELHGIPHRVNGSGRESLLISTMIQAPVAEVCLGESEGDGIAVREPSHFEGAWHLF